ncbi:MAG: hypothetical protein Greene041662_877, partial [Candidatus Peregrinibacteria bacterium Greene0416_62]
TFQGAGLTSCSADGETLAWNSTTKQFSCGDDDTGAGSSYTAGQGLTLNGSSAFSLTPSFSGTSLEIIGTASGRTLFANDTLASSGNLIVESLIKQGSGAIVALAAEYQTGAYLFSSGASTLALEAYTQEKTHGKNIAPHILFGYKGVFDTNLFRSASATLKTIGTFSVVGTSSGRILHAQDELRSSGSLIVGTTATLNGALDHNGTTVGFFGVTPATRPSAYTQTYSTADKTHENSTFGAVSEIPATDAMPFGYASAAQADEIPVELNDLADDVSDLKQLVNSIIDDLQSLGLGQ